jgi:hypothetical protein
MKNLIKKEKHQKQTKGIGLFTVNCTVQSTVKGIKKGKKAKGKKKTNWVKRKKPIGKKINREKEKNLN